MADDHVSIADTARIMAVPAGITKAEAIAIARRHDVVVLEGRVKIEKYWDGDRVPYEVVESGPNLGLTAGITLLWQLAAALGGTAWSSSNARIAVGTSTTAASAGQTALVTESARQIVDSAPTVSGATITFQATFGTGSANVAWNEIGVINASSGGTLLNRLVQNLGTKTSSASWVATVALTAA